MSVNNLHSAVSLGGMEFEIPVKLHYLQPKNPP